MESGSFYQPLSRFFLASHHKKGWVSWNIVSEILTAFVCVCVRAFVQEGVYMLAYFLKTMCIAALWPGLMFAASKKNKESSLDKPHSGTIYTHPIYQMS